PDGTPPGLPQPVFVNGIATPTLTFYKADTYTAAEVTIKDDQATSSGTFDRTSTALNGITVNPGGLTQYHISSATSSTTADSSGTFSLTIEAFDDWLNVENGDGCLMLLPVRVSG